MANEIEKFNALALADIEKINGFDDDDIEKLNGFEFTGTIPVQGIFAFGFDASSATSGTSNLVNTSGVVGSDVSAVGTASQKLGACEYGTGTAIFVYGSGG